MRILLFFTILITAKFQAFGQQNMNILDQQSAYFSVESADFSLISVVSDGNITFELPAQIKPGADIFSAGPIRTEVQWMNITSMSPRAKVYVSAQGVGGTGLSISLIPAGWSGDVATESSQGLPSKLVLQPQRQVLLEVPALVTGVGQNSGLSFYYEIGLDEKGSYEQLRGMLNELVISFSIEND